MKNLKGFQKKYLRGRAHKLKPTVFIGQKGITENVIRSTDEALNAHELIKVKFIDFKEKRQKAELSDILSERTNCQAVGMIGHIAIFFRPHEDPEKRKIRLPVK
jgi:RNA-binding protein